jgi:two-component system, cell cycle sensor histidine kinase and response regulator CckA
MIYLDLIFNLALLVAMSVISGFMEQHWPRQTRLGIVAQGILFGTVAVFGMLRPLHLDNGLFFDGRSVMVSLCALFYGPVAAVTASLITIACRIWMGGAGAIMGVLVILTSASIGVFAHVRFRNNPKAWTIGHLYLFGIVVHLAMLAMTFSLPLEKAITILQSIGAPVLLLYPLATLLAGKILLDHEFKRQFINELRQAREQLAITLRSIGEGVISTDLTGRILFMNPVAEHLTGWPQDAAKGKPLSEVFRTVDQLILEPVANTVTEVLAGAATATGDDHILLLARNQTSCHIAQNAAPMRDAEGRIMGVVLAFRDVSAEYIAREKLRENELLFRNLFEHHAAVKLLIDPDSGAILEANRAAEHFYGWRRDQLQTMNIRDLDSQSIDSPQTGPNKTTQHLHSESRHRLADGTHRNVEVFSSNIEVGGKDLLHTIIHDVTGRKRAEQALRESEANYKFVVSAMQESVSVIDIEGTFLFVNDKAASNLVANGVPEKVVGKNIRDLVPEDDALLLITSYQRTYASGQRLVREVAVQVPSGERWFLNTLQPLRYGREQRQAVLSISLDITERKQAEQEKEQLQTQLTQAQKMESVGRLTGGVAHDFNNILTVILGYTEMALLQVDPAAKLHADLKIIYEAGQRSADIVRQLLAFARQQTIAPRMLDLNATVASLLNMLRRLIGEDVSLSWFPAASLPPVHMDPGQIDQIMVNLCVNARDAINDTGAITIETGSVHLDEAYCAGNAGFIPGDYVVLIVSDNGCGMEQKLIDKIFEPFFTTKGVGGGTGLGLSTVYGIVKQNNGFINVYSEPNQGTSFKIYLPRHALNTPEHREEPAGFPEKSRGETILLVEDDPTILDMGALMLTELGYQVLSAGGPEEALRLAQEYTEAIDLLVTDVVMPEMNGRELCQRLLVLRPELKQLYMSGYTANVIAHHGVLDAGVHFLQKPFALRELGARVREALA